MAETLMNTIDKNPGNPVLMAREKKKVIEDYFENIKRASNLTRKQVTEVLQLMGANVSETVSRNTDILIVGSMPGSRKLGMAMRLGTKIITESQFAEILANS